MPVPSTIADLSTTAASNSPAGTESIGTNLDNYLRAVQAIVKQNASKGVDIASASNITIPDAGSYFVVTGNTTIATITDSWNGRLVVLKFSGALQLTHSANLILPGGANITTAAGDVFAFVNESTGVYRCALYMYAAGFQQYDANTVKSNATKNFTAGYTATSYNAGTKSSGTYTPDPANGNFQYAVNGGAHTLAPPSSDCTMIVQYTNNGSAGTITTSGFTKVSGTTPTTTNGDDFLAFITKINGFSYLAWQALQ